VFHYCALCDSIRVERAVQSLLCLLYAKNVQAGIGRISTSTKLLNSSLRFHYGLQGVVSC